MLGEVLMSALDQDTQQTKQEMKLSVSQDFRVMKVNSAGKWFILK